MKSPNRPVFIFLLVFILSFNMSCDIFTPIDPEVREEQNAYYTIIEAHALKQLWMYHFFQTYSNNYRRGELFEYEPTTAQLESLMDEFNVLMSYADAVEAAVDTLEAMQNDPSSENFGKPTLMTGLLSALSDFFSAGSSVGKNNRERILLIASNMTAAQQGDLYNKLGPEFNGKFANSDEFWVKLQNGELDSDASAMFRDFFDENGGINNTFGDLARNKNLTPGKIVVKDGSMLIDKGGAVIVEVVKTIAPPLGAGIEIAETGKKWYEKGEKMVDKPLEFVADEIKSRVSGKLAGMVDVEGLVDHVGISEGVANGAKTLMEVSIGTSDPQELVEKVIDWGAAKISSSDKSISAEVIVAKNQNPGAGLPDYIFGVGNYVNQLGETILTLPQGNWDISARTSRGETSSLVTTNITAQQETTVDVVANDTTAGGNDNPDDPIVEDPPTLSEMFDSLNINIFYKTLCIVLFDTGTDYKNFNIDNSPMYSLVYYAPRWNGYAFSIEYEYYDTLDIMYGGYGLREQIVDINGYFSLDSSYNIVLSLTAEREITTWGDEEGTFLYSLQTDQISTTQLPFYNSYYEVEYFGTENQSISINDLADGTHDYYSYSDSGRVLSSETHYDGFENLSNGRCGVTFGIVDTSVYNVIANY